MPNRGRNQDRLQYGSFGGFVKIRSDFLNLKDKAGDRNEVSRECQRFERLRVEKGSGVLVVRVAEIVELD
jgi:hypothetical protein